MKKLLGIIFFTIVGWGEYVQAQNLIIENNIRFLALGDSYTIGQGVLEKERWPNQLAERLTARGMDVNDVKIVARTGWTTRNLITELEANSPTFDYTLVSLLIGVNNQFQGLSRTQYQTEFELLLTMALSYAKNYAERVMVLSIPDYGFSPFGLNYPNVTQEINEFNAINKAITEKYNVTYIDVTSSSREGLNQPDLVAGDNLHPSAKMYGIWVDSIMHKASLVNIVTSIATSEIDVASIYPNPAKENITLPQGTTAITITDSIGRVVYATESLNSLVLDIAYLAPGQYRLVLSTTDGNRQTRLLKL